MENNASQIQKKTSYLTHEVSMSETYLGPIDCDECLIEKKKPIDAALAERFLITQIEATKAVDFITATLDIHTNLRKVAVVKSVEESVVLNDKIFTATPSQETLYIV